MLAYPGYTVRLIEKELSYREIKELMKNWEEEKPISKRLERIEKILMTHTRVKILKKKDSDERVIQGLAQMGFM